MSHRTPLHPTWHLVAFVVVALAASLVIMYFRFGALSQWMLGPCFLP